MNTLPPVRRAVILIAVIIVTLTISVTVSYSEEPLSPVTPPKWTRALPADLCPGGSHTTCHLGSPILADINNDTFLDIVAVTNNGHVVVIKHNGSLLWDKDIAPSFNMPAGSHEIHSSPAVADIDNDGFLEIAVGAGTMQHDTCTKGGMIVLSHTGSVEPGWPRIAIDEDIPPPGCPDTIVSSPALGDLDRDGDLEIVAAGFDKRIYAWHHNGTLLPGFPPNSIHHLRFPTWDAFVGRLGDDSWASPALADLDQDGYLDIIITTGEGNYEALWGGNANGWVCPYALPPGNPPGYCGGNIYAFDRFGNIMDGFPRFKLEALFSSPAAVDIDDDGDYEIFFGTSDYYRTISPDHPTVGYRLYGIDHNGDDLPGWNNGKATGGSVVVSPSVGDIAGDSQVEIVVLAADRKLYAWHANGLPVAGFPMTPKDLFGATPVPFKNLMGIVLADYDGDPKMEIIFNEGWVVNVVDGNGQQLTGTNYPNQTLPIYSGQGMLINTPAVGDIDKDGKLELVATNSIASVWDLPNASVNADWPMFKLNQDRTSTRPIPADLNVLPDVMRLFHQIGTQGNAVGAARVINAGGGYFDWQASVPANVTFSPNSGTLLSKQADTAVVTVPTNGKPEGVHNIGTVTVTATSDTSPLINSSDSFPVILYVGDIYQVRVPIIHR